MTDGEIDDVLNQAAGASPEVDPGLLEGISRSVGSSLTPVRPLPPKRVLTAAAMTICAAVGMSGAAVLGMHGIEKMSAVQAGVIFPVLGMLIWLAARLSVSEMSPGSRRGTDPWVWPVAGSLTLLAVFAVLFQEYRTERFLSQGLTCLKAGLLHAIPTALATWLLLRRGFAVHPVASGLALGTLAGLAGVTMLELHCVNFEAPHVMLWHTAVLPLSGILAVSAVWTWRRVTGSRT
jgi:hypothetical protein